MRDYWKLIWSIVGTLVLGLQTMLSDGDWSNPEKVACFILVGQTILVWAAPDTTVWKHVKTSITIVLAGLAVLELAILNGLTGDELMSILIAILQAAGVIGDPRRPVHVVEGTTTERRLAA